MLLINFYLEMEQFYDVLRSDRMCPTARSGHPVRPTVPRPVPCTGRGYQGQTSLGSLGILDLGALAVVCVWGPPCAEFFTAQTCGLASTKIRTLLQDTHDT